MQGIHSVLIFVSIGIALGLTLLLGGQWGALMGILAYLSGSNVLLNQEVKKLKAYIDRLMNELPELLRQMSSKAEAQSNPSMGSAQPATAPKPQRSMPSNSTYQCLIASLSFCCSIYRLRLLYCNPKGNLHHRLPRFKLRRPPVSPRHRPLPCPSPCRPQPLPPPRSP